MMNYWYKARHKIRRHWVYTLFATGAAVLRYQMSPKKIHILVGYDNAANFGDQLTPDILRYFGLKPIHCPRYISTDLIGAGSILKSIPEGFSGYIMGSGFMKDESTHIFPFANILLLRGKLSQHTCQASPSLPLGDPGIIADLIYKKILRKKKTILLGIIPHYSHIDHPIIQTFKHKLGNDIKIINVRRKPAKVIRDISACKYILSSSLHGLIIADSLNIPNCWITVPGSTALGKFKFNDYYSCYGLKRAALEISHNMNLNDLLSATRLIPENKLASIKNNVSMVFKDFSRTYIEQNKKHATDSTAFPLKRSSILMSLSGDRNEIGSRTRGFRLAEELSTQNTKCSIRHDNGKASMLYFALDIMRNETIFFQNTYSRYHCLLLYFAKLLHKNTILDLDNIPSQTSHLTPLKNVKFMIQNSSAITVSNQVLFDYASRFSNHVHLIPSNVYLKYYQAIGANSLLASSFPDNIIVSEKPS